MIKARKKSSQYNTHVCNIVPLDFSEVMNLGVVKRLM